MYRLKARVKRPKALLVVTLTMSMSFLILYSMLDLQYSHAQSEVLEIPLTATPLNVTIMTKTSVKERQKTTASPNQVSSSASVLEKVSISETFWKSVPKNSAYWNRKFHSMLRVLDHMENVTSHESPDRFHCMRESDESLHLNIPDFNSYPALYQDFLHSMACHDSQIVIDQPNKCGLDNGDDHVFLLFAIKSTPQHFMQRQAVRDTWGKEGVYLNGLRVRTVFLLGRSHVDDPNLDKLISFEAKEFGDLLIWDFQDSFYNLTLKENVFFKWLLQSCPRVSFVFKGDDDVFANTHAILNYLKTLNPTMASKLYTGQIISQASPLRDRKNKYYVPQSFYEGAYPPYAGGGGFLFSGSLIHSLYSISRYIPFFPIDDVYTGMCFQALGILPEKHKGFQTFDIREQDRDNACVHRDLLLVHQRDPQQTTRLWRAMHSPLLTC
ncbi:N-acetyllactosaminide beta-1,3-N-acetylglucosaminyltransferase 2 [Chanos chanos]|uniref:Hexosyltransferase n=1 Tax=Chanos chanos TaxID=29144 RepID=A0A6J2UQP9_CHACN|nr:N-acetyllactosaminide beta-1,3-N-acetylglucosaminyltransferase 2-like [Chanos chanos]